MDDTDIFTCKRCFNEIEDYTEFIDYRKRKCSICLSDICKKCFNIKENKQHCFSCYIYKEKK